MRRSDRAFLTDFTESFVSANSSYSSSGDSMSDDSLAFSSTPRVMMINKAQAVFHHFNDLLGSDVEDIDDNDDEDDDDMEEKVDDSYGRKRQSGAKSELVALLQELNTLSNWRNNNTNNLSTFNSNQGLQIIQIPFFLSSISLREWETTSPITVAIEYSLFLWSVGQLQSSDVDNFGKSCVGHSEEIRRGNLMCEFKLHLNHLLKQLVAIRNHKHASKRRCHRTSTSVSLEDVSVDVSKFSQYQQQGRKWNLFNKYKSQAALALSKSMPYLKAAKSQLSAGLAESKDNFVNSRRNQENKDDSRSSDDKTLQSAIEAALFTGEALGHLVSDLIDTA